MADRWNNIFSDNKSGNADLPGKFRLRWVEESLEIPSENIYGNQGMPTRNFLGKSINQKTLTGFLIIIGFGIIILIGKIFILQIIQGNDYFASAEQNRIRLKPIPAERGIIFDRDGVQLVQNIPNFSLNIIPQEIPSDPVERQKIVQSISETSEIPYEEVEAILYKYRSYNLESVAIKENLDYNSALKLYVNNSNLPGVSIESGTKRDYLFAHQEKPDAVLSLSHLLGYLGKLNDTELDKLTPKGYLLSDNIGRTGLEKKYEAELRGHYGLKKVEVDAVGREQSVIAEEPPTPGDNLKLSLDLEGQRELEHLVTNMAKKIHQNKIAAVAIDPRNGEILAMVSNPTYSNNLFSGGITQKDYGNLIKNPDQPLFNRVIAGNYPSGSTIKPVISAAALEEGIITKNTSVLSVGGIQVGDHFFKDWKAGGHGTTNVIRAIAWSVNTFFYYIGGGYGNFQGLGVDKITAYLKKFNLGNKTGIDLPGEAAGFVPSRDWKEKTKGEPWYVGDTYNLSIGQGDLLVTPLQVAVWTAAVANGGTLITPHLGTQITDASGNTLTDINPPPKNTNLVSTNNETIVREGMRQCIISGSCQLLSYLPFSTGAKTGTAQWSSTKPTHAWFTAFAPFENPRVVIAVLIEEGGEGATVAMPIAKDWLSWWGKKYLTTR